MVKRKLVVTALAETLPEKNDSVVLLGDWCKIYSKYNYWNEIDYVISPYHWDDRQKLHQDYVYLQEVYERLLTEISCTLNTIHKCQHSVRYWRIIIGPWLGYFTQILFDRWEMLKNYQKNDDILCVKLKKHSKQLFIPNGSTDFSSLIVSDEWNDFIYGKIAHFLGMPIELSEKILFEEKELKTIKSVLKYFKKQINTRLKSTLNFLFGFLGNNKDYFFISTYLGIKKNIQLQINLGQFPQLWQFIDPPIIETSEYMREWKLTESSDVEFENLLRSLIPKNMPFLYLEGYSNLLKKSHELPWPKNPRAIFTCNSFISDDIFKIWAAEKVDQGTPFVVGQHGGNYGMALWSFSEDHEIAISDQYLTWGWFKKNSYKTIPIGNFKKLPKSKPSWKGGALLVETTVPRQSYHLFSAPVSACQWQKYHEDQINFVKSLSNEIRDSLIIRLSSQDYDYFQQKRWENIYPAITISDGQDSIVDLMNKCRIYISTYNATTFLESMTLNFPTIIFWNTSNWELCEEAAQKFEKLISVGIFHKSPESAAKKINEIWCDVSGWWFDEKIQSSRLEFCKYYSKSPSNTIPLLKKTFQNLSCAS